MQPQKYAAFPAAYFLSVCLPHRGTWLFFSFLCPVYPFSLLSFSIPGAPHSQFSSHAPFFGIFLNFSMLSHNFLGFSGHLTLFSLSCAPFILFHCFPFRFSGHHTHNSLLMPRFLVFFSTFLCFLTIFSVFRGTWLFFSFLCPVYPFSLLSFFIPGAPHSQFSSHAPPHAKPQHSNDKECLLLILIL